MKSAEEIMQILQALDLTDSYRDAGELAGVSHHTVARYVAARDAGRLVDRPAARPQLIDEFLPKLEEWMEHSRGKIRSDKAHARLLALGDAGSERTTRRAVAQTRQAFNLHPAAFDEPMPKTLATATVDRLLHHAHVCQTTGDSVRLRQALAGQG